MLVRRSSLAIRSIPHEVVICIRSAHKMTPLSSYTDEPWSQIHHSQKTKSACRVLHSYFGKAILHPTSCEISLTKILISIGTKKIGKV